MGDDGSLLHVVRVDRDLVVPLLEVELTEDCGPHQAASDVGHVREGVAVGFSEEIEVAVVATGLAQLLLER